MMKLLERAGSIMKAQPAKRLADVSTTVSKSDNRPSKVNDHIVSSALATMFTTAVSSKAEYEQQFSIIENFYIVESLLSTVVDDALTPDITTGEIVRITSPDPIIDAELKKLQLKFDFDNLVLDLTPGLLAHGDYSLSLNVERGKGITKIKDNLETNSVVAFYNEGLPEKFIVKNADSISIKNPVEIAHFILSGRKIRVPTLSETDIERVRERSGSALADALLALPTYARVGRPLLMGVLSKIKELQLLESLIPAVKLAELSQGSMVSIDVPASADPKAAFDIAREYENIFNSKVGINNQVGMITVSDIMSTAGRIKVVPSYQGKGSMQSVDVKNSSNTSEIFNTIRDTRDVICTSIGFPTELLFGGANRLEIVKKYTRYVRKIKSIQSTISAGLTQICMAHLRNTDRTSYATVKDIDIYFLNEIVNIDELEKLEFNDSKLTLVSNILGFIERLADSPGFEDMARDSKEEVRKYIDSVIDWIKNNDPEDGDPDDILKDPTSLTDTKADRLTIDPTNKVTKDDTGDEV